MLNIIHWNVNPVMFVLDIPMYINVMLVVYVLLGYYYVARFHKKNAVKKASGEDPKKQKKLSQKDKEKEGSNWVLWAVIGCLFFVRFIKFIRFHQISFIEVFNPVNIPPTPFHFELRWYSMGFLIAFTLGFFVMRYMFQREKVNEKYLESLLIYMFIAVLGGARLGHCIFYEPSYYLSGSHWIEMFLPFGNGPEGWHFTGYQGLASHGAAFGILLAMWLYFRKYRMNPVWIIDRLVIIIALGGAFIRLGNLFNSEIYGVATNLPWGFIYERNGETIPKHPTQLYESISYLIIFLICFLVYCKKDGKMRTGAMFGWWLIALFGVRFIVEFVKEEQVEFEKGMVLDMGQWLSVPFILLGVILCFCAYKGLFNDNIFIKKGDSIINRKK